MSFQGTRQILYFWVDPRIYSAENQKYLKEFKMHFQIESFSSLEAFKERLNQLSDDLVIKLIVAASLPV